ncbi:hypothetical protein H4696_003351 [Amycolatopsis lexingtonensis]|uniref:Uncharacterized protein n=1 Tax=Amycolatopsis lexingtonensis TaxID=218822 RepID=A0ABR9HZA8_9PSEU|nr:hypothetical protein [Amycolatopsis lexingtonensis]MBE1496251.1 hypothetical protein [Amycolatopsis lexingtonensis]
MSPGRRRQAIRDAARAAGLGEVVRIHRSHSGVAIGLWVLAGIGAVVAVIVTIILRYEQSTIWQWPLLAWSALVGLAVLVTHFGPVHGGRHWIAVAEGGVVVWQRDSGWTATWAETPQLNEDTMCGAGDLATSRLRRAPVGAWTARRITSLAALTLFGAAAVWFTAVPVARNYLVGDAPAKTDQLARLCDGGRAFGSTAAYEGAAPHPVVVFAEGTERYSSAPKGDPAAVQLVGCVVITGGREAGHCDYEDGYTTVDYRGQYRVDVVEAHTGRLVGSFPIEAGKARSGCGERLLVPASEADTKRRKDYDLPESENLGTHLSPFVGGVPR